MSMTTRELKAAEDGTILYPTGSGFCIEKTPPPLRPPLPVGLFFTVPDQPYQISPSEKIIGLAMETNPFLTVSSHRNIEKQTSSVYGLRSVD